MFALHCSVMSSGRIYRFSALMEQLRQECIVRPISDDPRMQDSGLLGYPIRTVQEKIINCGRANFDQPYVGNRGALSPDDLVALYAFLNLPAHMSEMLACLEKFVKDEADIERMHFLDIGCGPMTAGLALAEYVGARVPIEYVGVDISHAMRVKALRLARYARKCGLLHEDSRVQFKQSLESIRRVRRLAHEHRTRRHLVVILSFLLASPTLNLTALVDEIMASCDRLSAGPVSVLYTNSTKDIANLRFRRFRDALERHAFELREDNEEKIQYELPSGLKTCAFRYSFFHRPEQTTQAGSD
jgi:SAM-dependent methyltransferase